MASGGVSSLLFPRLLFAWQILPDFAWLPYPPQLSCELSRLIPARLTHNLDLREPCRMKSLFIALLVGFACTSLVHAQQFGVGGQGMGGGPINLPTFPMPSNMGNGMNGMNGMGTGMNGSGFVMGGQGMGGQGMSINQIMAGQFMRGLGHRHSGPRYGMANPFAQFQDPYANQQQVAQNATPPKAKSAPNRLTAEERKANIRARAEQKKAKAEELALQKKAKAANKAPKK
jgi:hypothetical protein